MNPASSKRSYEGFLKMRAYLKTTFLFLAAGFATIATADGFVIKRNPKLGASAKYSMDVLFDANVGQGTLKATLVEKVVDIDKNGNYSVEQSQIDATGTFDKEKIDISPRTPITLVYKPNGQVTSIVGDLTDANSYRMENLGSLLDPGHPIKINDTWIAEIKGDKTLGTQNVRIQYKLIAEEKVGDIDTLKIKGLAKEVDANLNAVNPPTTDFTIWISKEDGSMVKLESKWTDAPFPGQSSPIPATIKILRIGS